MSDRILTDAGLLGGSDKILIGAGLLALSDGILAYAMPQSVCKGKARNCLQGQRLTLVCLQGQRLTLVCLQGQRLTLVCLQGQRLTLVCLLGQRLTLVCFQGPMPDTFQCRCPRGYTGNLCEQVDACSGNPCLNGGTCTNQPLGVDTSSYLCTCLPGFTGNQCQTSTSSPSSSQCDGVVTCLNAGMCLSRADGSYMCQ